MDRAQKCAQTEDPTINVPTDSEFPIRPITFRKIINLTQMWKKNYLELLAKFIGSDNMSTM